MVKPSDAVAVGIAVVLIALWAYALVDWARTDEREMRLMSKPVWGLFLLLFNAAGAVVWLVLGRPQRR